MIAFNQVTKTYPSGHTALEEITFDIDPGEFVFLLGPSGSGKTTILRLLIRQTQPTSGHVSVSQHDLNQLPDKEIPHLRRQIGSAFQDFKLLPDKSAFENVAIALDIMGKNPTDIASLTKQLLDKVGLKQKIHHFPSQLSGGEIQRVAIARALASQPVLLFADEPTGNLDPTTSDQIVSLLEQIHSDGTTVIMATHDVNLANKYNHRQIHLNQGKLTKDTKVKKPSKQVEDKPKEAAKSTDTKQITKSTKKKQKAQNS